MKEYFYYVYWVIRTWPMRWGFPKYRIMSIEETVDLIVEKQKSISRLGDADFLLLISERDVSYQKLTPEISNKLKEVLECRDDRFLIALPDTINSTRDCKRISAVHWKMFINNHGKKLEPYFDRNYKYGNSNMTRFYIDSKNKKRAIQLFEKVKTIWHNKDVVIIEGVYSRLGIGNDLLDNSKSVKRILAPHMNAFDIYKELKEYLLQFPKDTLFLFALGPTATILCCELALEGYRAIDIGNIDMEYMWMKMGVTDKTSIKGRFSVETKNTESLDLDSEDKMIYEDSIIKTFIYFQD